MFIISFPVCMIKKFCAIVLSNFVPKSYNLESVLVIIKITGLATRANLQIQMSDAL